MNSETHEEAVNNEAEVFKKDTNVIIMKIRVTDKTSPQEIFNMLPKYLGGKSKLKKGFSKKGNNGKSLKAGVIGIGNESSISGYVLLQDSNPATEDEDDNITHSFTIYFKITEDKDENILSGVNISRLIKLYVC